MKVSAWSASGHELVRALALYTFAGENTSNTDVLIGKSVLRQSRQCFNCVCLLLLVCILLNTFYVVELTANASQAAKKKKISVQAKTFVVTVSSA